MMIQDYHFGSMTVESRVHVKDLKIIEGKVVPRWWRRDGHSLGIEDVDDVLAASPRYFVVGTGESGRMVVESALAELLAERGIDLIDEPTGHAIHTFNRLHAEGKNVAGAFHLTC